MTDAPAPSTTFLNAIREFEDRLEDLADAVTAAIDMAAGVNIEVDRFIEPEDHPTDKTKVIVDRDDLESLAGYLEDVGPEISGQIQDAVENFFWELNRAKRDLKKALADTHSAQ